LDNNIRLLGQVSQDVVFDTMAKAKILLHTSKFEGQCLVYAEGLSQGMYVVSYPVGWFDSSEKHITGKSVEELTERVQQLLSQSLSFQEEKVINTDHIVEAYLKLYKGGENNA
jgi:glycosyltransferase involved in cell wall biosynthesis